MAISDIRFKVKKITYRNNDTKFAIIRATMIKESLKLKIPKEVSIKGVFPVIFIGDEMECKAEYLLDDVYGYYFQVKDIPQVLKPENEQALVEFIKKRVSRLGLKTARMIVESLGLDSLRLIKENYRVLTSIKGITEKKAKKIYDELIKHESYENLVVFIQSLGIEANIAVQIYDKFEDTSISRIRSNPYCICYDNTRNHIPFRYAEKIAYKLNKPFDFIERIKVGILEYIDYRVTNYGDLCVYSHILYDELNTYLKSFGYYDQSVSEKEIKIALDSLIMDNFIVLETNSDKEICIYKKMWNIIENSIVQDLTNLLTGFSEPLCLREDISKFIENYEHNYFPLDIKQKNAVYMALLNRFSILTGGPGTGKVKFL